MRRAATTAYTLVLLGAAMKQMTCYAMPPLSLYLHFSSNAITLCFNILAILIRQNEVQESLYSAFSFAFGVHMLITPYRIFAGIGILQSRFNAVDCYGRYVLVIYEI